MIISLPVNWWIPAVITLAVYTGTALLPRTIEVTVANCGLISDIALKIAMTSRHWFALALSLAVWLVWTMIGGAA